MEDMTTANNSVHNTSEQEEIYILFSTDSNN